MRITVLSETDPVETRAAITPEMVKKYKNLGADVVVQAGAGNKANISDAELEAAGAAIAQSAEDALRGADIVLKVRRPADGELNGLKDGALVIGIMDPYGQDAALKTLADAGASAFAMELTPRITRAQVMDVLSSQANLAGYRAMVDAAEEYGKAIPMMMTAAGTVPAARIFVMGAGVAGLQAIATARRMGGIVTATDVRPAAKEQVESLGAKFVAVEDEEFRQAETAGGYAKEMSKEYQAKQAELVSSHIAKQDIVITTALIPGRPAPKLVSRAMVESMKPGSVIVDLGGGGCGGGALCAPGVWHRQHRDHQRRLSVRDGARRGHRRDHVHRIDHCGGQAQRQHERKADHAAAPPCPQHRAGRSACPADRLAHRRRKPRSVLADRARRLRAGRHAHHSDRRRRHAGRGLDAQLLLGLGSGGHRFHARQLGAHHHRLAGGLGGRDPVLHHVQGHEPLLYLGDPRRLRRRGGRAAAGAVEARPVK